MEKISRELFYVYRDWYYLKIELSGWMGSVSHGPSSLVPRRFVLTSCLVNYSTPGRLHSSTRGVLWFSFKKMFTRMLALLRSSHIWWNVWMQIRSSPFSSWGLEKCIWPEVCSAVLRNGLELEDLSVQLMPADDRLRCVHLRDLPVEVDNDVVSSFLSRYGKVLSVDHCYFDDFPSLRNGNRLVKILLAQDISSGKLRVSCLVPSSTASVLYLPRFWSPCPSLPAFWSLPALSPARSCCQGVYAGLGPLCFCF